MEEPLATAHRNHERLEKMYRECNEFYGLTPQIWNFKILKVQKKIFNITDTFYHSLRHTNTTV